MKTLLVSRFFFFGGGRRGGGGRRHYRSPFESGIIMCKVFFVEMKSVFLKGTFKRGAGEPKNEKREVERGWRAQKEIFLLGLFPFKNKQDFVTVVKVCLVAEHKDYDWFFLPRQQHYCSN